MSSPHVTRDPAEPAEDAEEDLPTSEETLEGNPSADELFSLHE